MDDKLGALLFHLLLLAGFVYALLIMHRVVKPSFEARLLQQPTPLIRVLVYLGTLVFMLACVLDIMGK
ncbi:MAG TPA: hypothetical protein VHB48_04090 [Chitinophagaceae bacterium]|nr:hypothetical protein [Chitinophagaceae bacterium]